MLKLIKSIKIGGHIYKVLFPYLFRERTDISSQSAYDMCEIRIGAVDINGNDRVDSVLLEDFWHEIAHCINKTYCAGKIEEDEIIGLGEGLNQVISDNFNISVLKSRTNEI